MRIGGLASGIDTESIIKDLMQAERIPLNKLEQDKTKLEWQRDAFRDVNKLLSELDNMMLDMKLSSTYNSKMISSTQSDAVKATANAGASNGTYSINVSQLATSAINVSENELTLNQDQTLHEQGITEDVVFTTFDKEGNAQTHTYQINEGDKLSDLFKKINDDKDSPVRMTFDENANKVIMETTRTGKYNTKAENGIDNEIVFTDSFLTDSLHLSMSEEKGGENAKFTYNNAYETESRDNQYSLNGVTFQFYDTTDGNATLTVNNDVDASVENIMKFVDKYNEIVETINGSQQEEKYRDFPPLTEEQKKEMTEREIELWEEKAKSGLLKGESSLTNGLYNMRQSWYSSVNGEGAFSSLTEIGITTSNNYLDGGKLVVDESKLREALTEDPESVQKLFSNSSDGEDRGLINRLEDAVDITMAQISQRAGKATDTSLDNYTLGKRMKDIDSRITNFERRLELTEARYWRQFSEMERAISMMNQQSSMLMSNFGSGMAQG
ncbi:flagellar hook-associated protein 2 [Oceanobacillus kimchii]|uniref:flagellar hook-associated protein 2 n=1 Tax=Oceanobacillus kimchii TaxID=746691 RepID=UPI00232D3D79|nr:flagellar hook-associated protein 2 [Oceanobacillus kimchii]